MRRVPIACCLEEGGLWTRWSPRHCTAPIRLYADGWIEDDILKGWRPKQHTRLGIKYVRRLVSGQVCQGMPYSLLFRTP